MYLCDVMGGSMCSCTKIDTHFSHCHKTVIAYTHKSYPG